MPRSAAPPTRVNRVLVDGREVAPGPELTLPPGTARVALRWAGVTLVHPERLRYRYRLEGFEAGWVDAGADVDAQYTNLNPGAYRFTVQALAEGGWGPPAEVAVTVRPTVWQRPAVQILAVLLVILLVAAAPLLRVRRLQARERELDIAVHDALREAKVLRGLLPVCAWCRRIRDADGHWNTMEEYVADNTHAQVTHGMCPECFAKSVGPVG